MRVEIPRSARESDRAASPIRSASWLESLSLPQNVRFLRRAAENFSGNIGLGMDTPDNPLPMPGSCIRSDLHIDFCRSISTSCPQGTSTSLLFHRIETFLDKIPAGCRVA